MKKALLIITAALLLLCLVPAVQAEDLSHIRAILEKIDAQSRFEGTDFSAVLTLIVEDP